MKKLLSVLMASLMIAITLVGCGTTSDSDTIKIGGIGPTTGAYQNYGISVRNGAEIAIEEINAAGGIAGKQIEFNMQDSQGDPESAVNAYGMLIDWGMDVSIGTVLSGEMASVAAASKDDDILLVSPSASANTCLETNDKAFRICFYDSYQGTKAADYIKDNNMATEVAVLYESDIDYSIGLYEAFEEECSVLGISITEVQSFTKETSTDFSTQINALLASGAKLIFIPIYAEEASTFLTQAQGKFDENVLFFGADGLDGILGKVAQDVTIANNVLMLTPFISSSSDEAVASFVAKYEEKYDLPVDQFAADGYDAIYAIKLAVETAGTTSGSELAAIMPTLTLEGITGTMSWEATGNTSKNAQAILYYDGVGTEYGK